MYQNTQESNKVHIREFIPSNELFVKKSLTYNSKESVLCVRTTCLWHRSCTEIGNISLPWVPVHPTGYRPPGKGWTFTKSVCSTKDGYLTFKRGILILEWSNSGVGSHRTPESYLDYLISDPVVNKVTSVEFPSEGCPWGSCKREWRYFPFPLWSFLPFLELLLSDNRDGHRYCQSRRRRDWVLGRKITSGSPTKGLGCRVEVWWFKYSTPFENS